MVRPVTGVSARATGTRTEPPPAQSADRIGSPDATAAQPEAAAQQQPAARLGALNADAWRLRLAQLFVRAGRPGAAESLYRKLLARQPRLAGAVVELARLLSQQRRYGEAAALWCRAAALRPRSTGPLFQLARALHHGGDLAGASEQYLRVVALDPAHAKAAAAIDGVVQQALRRWRAGDGEAGAMPDIVGHLAAMHARSPVLQAIIDRAADRFAAEGDALRDKAPGLAVERYRAALTLDAAHPAALRGIARAAYANGKLDEAAAALQPLLQSAPVQPEVLALAGRVHLRREDWSQATAMLRQLDAAVPGSAETKEMLARALAGDGQLAAAAGVYEDLVRLRPDEVQILGRLFGIYSRLGDWPAACRIAGLLVERDASSAQPRILYAQALQQIGETAQAEAQLERALSLDAGEPDALAMLGRLRIRSDPEGAFTCWERLAQLRPQAIEPPLQMARLCLRQGRSDDARRFFEAVLARDPEHAEALAGIGQALADADRGAAMRHFAAWAERRPADPLPLVLQAQLLERMRQPAEAERAYRAALSRAAGDEGARIGLARLLSNEGQWPAAAELYEAVLQKNPSRPDALLGLGRCLERLGRDEEALAAYDKVLAKSPGEINALVLRSRLLRQLGRVDAAIDAWREVTRRDPGNADAYHELVFMLASAERETEALAVLAQAETALPASAATSIRLALAAQAGQLHDEAVAYFERAIAAEPQEASHHAQLGQYYLSQGIVDGAFHSLLASRQRNPADVTVTKRLVETVKTLNDVGVDHVALHRAPPHIGEVLVPERLFHVVRRLADTEVRRYVPVARRIVAVSASLAPGGAERQLANMLRGLSAPRFGLDLALCVISLGSRGRRDFFLPLLAETPVDIATVGEAAVESHLRAPEAAPYARLIGHFPAHMVAPIACWLAEFRRRRPQVVHAWQDSTNMAAAVAALLAGVPRIVLCSRSIRPNNPRRTLRRFMREAYQVLADHPAVVLSNNSRAGADDHADWLGIDPSRIQVVYNGVDFATLEHTVDPAVTRQARASLGIPADAPLLGGVFRMSEEKRPLLWVEVAAAVARRDGAAHFVVCGDGPMRHDMQQLAASLGIADRFHLAGTQPNIASWYKAMDVVMLTSRYEGLPNVPLEAQSLGVPIVAPDVGGMAETIWHGATGWAIANADAPALAERVLFCFRDRAWSANAARQAPVFVRERFGIETMLRRNLEVYGITPEPPDARALP